MTNEFNPTITLNTTSHGTFKVDVDHLNMSLVTRFNRREEALLDEVHALVGEGDYSDLTRSELLILISYLSGGSAD